MRTVVDAKEARYEYLAVVRSGPLRLFSNRLSLRGLEAYSLNELVDAHIGLKKDGDVTRVYLVGPDNGPDTYYGEREFELWRAK